MLILMFEKEHYTNISALAGIGEEQWLGMGFLYPGPGYEAIICFTHGKQSKLEVGLGTARVGMLALFQMK